MLFCISCKRHFWCIKKPNRIFILLDSTGYGIARIFVGAPYPIPELSSRRRAGWITYLS